MGNSDTHYSNLINSYKYNDVRFYYINYSMVTVIDDKIIYLWYLNFISTPTHLFLLFLSFFL